MGRGKAINSPWMYAFGMLAMMIPSHAFSTFYSYYYVDKLGLGLGLATLARTIFMIWDAVNQPLAGYLSDRTNSRYGRRKPWVYASIPLFMIAFVFVFSAPDGMSQMGLFTWFLVALLFYEAIATILWVNYGALFPELFRGDTIRKKASAIQQGYQIVAILIGSAVAPILFNGLGFSSMSIIFGLMFVVFMILCMRFTQEDAALRDAPKMGLKESFSATLANKPFWVFNISNSFAQTVNGLLSSMIPFYAKYVLRVDESMVTFLLASIFVSVIPLVGVWFWIIKRMDPVKAWRLSLLAYAVSVIPLWFGSTLLGGIMAGIIVGFGLAGFLVTPPVVNSLIIDRDFAETGRRREGVYTAVSGFITRSSGLISALAFLIVGMIFGYESGENPGNDPETTFRVLISVVPLLLLLISFILSYFVRLRGDEDGSQHG
ncbi:MFS transporter [Paenibacillus sp. 1011MAR3C5]|uniref:MFS transporter n=1 Tax=Paenibacillus sp. 1011MAR3C5 TaxID=1675787 RepID=UPI000E6C4193|nr:MFS transporter [Paenibacillus sp. 1011MAR3C5]RJE88491.1 MFS transporter [Paenibacillus sp. 1011MAR3C5]